MRKKNVSYEEIKRMFGPDPSQEPNQPIQIAKTWEEIIYDYLNAPEPSDPSESTKNPTPAKRKWDSEK